MAIALVQTKSNGTQGDDVTITFDANVAAGNLIVVCAITFDSLNTVTVSVTDSLGNTYVQAGSYARSGLDNGTFSIFYAKNIVGGACTITILAANFSDFGADMVAGYCAEVSGCDTMAPLEDSVGATGTGTVADAGDLVTTGEAFLVAAAGSNASDLATGTGWTLLDPTNYFWFTESMYRIPTVGGTYPAEFGGGTGTWGAVAAAFKAAGGGAGATPKGVFGKPLDGPMRRVVYP